MAGVLGLTVGLVVGYGTGRVSTGTPINPLSDQKGGYQAGYADAMKLVGEAGLLPPVQEESLALTGTVTSVSGDRLVMEANLTGFDPLGMRNLPKDRTVIVTAETKVTIMTEVPPAEFEAAQNAYAEALQGFEPDEENPVPPPPPNQYVETAASLQDLKAGDRISVVAAADILKAESFEAVSISVIPPAPQAPEPLPEAITAEEPPPGPSPTP